MRSIVSHTLSAVDVGGGRDFVGTGVDHFVLWTHDLSAHVSTGNYCDFAAAAVAAAIGAWAD